MLGVTLVSVEVSAHDIANIPPQNLRVRREEFVAVWRAAEELHDRRVREHVPDWSGAGVVMTCRWLARATVRPSSGLPYMAFAPVTQREKLAFPELIAEESLEAEKTRDPAADLGARPPGLAGRGARDVPVGVEPGGAATGRGARGDSLSLSLLFNQVSPEWDPS